MFTNVAFDARKALSGVAAAVVVAFGAATLDQGHLIGAPKGVITIGEPIALADSTVAMLPEITVTASRLTDGRGSPSPRTPSRIMATTRSRNWR